MADIVLKNREGQDVPYEGVNVLRVYTPEGNTELYHNGEIVTATVEPDFSEGNIVVDAGEGKFYSEVTIKKPENLRPEVILKDENVAGIVGTLEPSSGGEDGGGGGAVAVSPSDINFYDYDGTIVAAWTLEELAAATALPDNPEHDGLISQGWNWTLEELKATNRAMDVGQMYITDDGKTRLYIKFTNSDRMDITLCFSQTVANGVTIDWGDGSATENKDSTGYLKLSHTYENCGEYVITLDPADECTLGLGSGSTNYNVLNAGIAADSSNKIYCYYLKKVEIGKNLPTIGTAAFYLCSGLELITIPRSVTQFGEKFIITNTRAAAIIVPIGVTEIPTYFAASASHAKCISFPFGVTAVGASAVSGASAIRCIRIPNGVTEIPERLCNPAASIEDIFIHEGVKTVGPNAFSCGMAQRVVISQGVTTIGTYGFTSCGEKTTRITVPDSVESIGDSAFYNCNGVKQFHFKRNSPPTLGKNVFSGISSDCIIYVPKGRLSSYKNATNWSAYASYMQEEAE